ncbi:iron-enterobactin ABC transporter permease [Stackebrandtia albiflava]
MVGAPAWRLRAGPVRLRVRRRTVWVCAAAVVACLMLATAALMLGRLPLGVGDVLAVLTGQTDGFHRTVVLEWRAPRAVAAVVFGAALGVAGAMFQSITRNALASPDVLGVSTGAYTGALLMMIVAGGGTAAAAGGALVGAVAASAAVYLLAFRSGVQGNRLVIVGIAVTAMLTSFNTWLILAAELDAAVSAAVWGQGDLSGAAWGGTAPGVAVIAVLLLTATLLAPGLRQLDLGDDAAAGSGVAVERTRLRVMAVAVGLTAVVTALAGPVAFIALAAPQIARRVMRAPGVPLAGAAVFGAVLLLVSDLVAQHVVPTVLPVGIVTVVVGGSYLVWLLIEEARRRL